MEGLNHLPWSYLVVSLIWKRDSLLYFHLSFPNRVRIFFKRISSYLTLQGFFKDISWPPFFWWCPVSANLRSAFKKNLQESSSVSAKYNFVPPAVQQLILNCIVFNRKFAVMEISKFGVGSFFMEFHGDPDYGWARSSKPALRRIRPNKYVVHVGMLLLLLTQAELHCSRYIYRQHGNQNSVWQLGIKIPIRSCQKCQGEAPSP